MAAIGGSFFNGFFSLSLLFFHLGCFTLFSNPKPNPDQRSQPKRRKVTPFSASPPSTSFPRPQISTSQSIRSYLSNLVTFRRPNNDAQSQHQPTIAISPPSPLHSIPIAPDHTTNIRSSPVCTDKPEISADASIKRSSSSATRSDIFPCAACGDVLTKPHLLDLHQATKHSLSELCDGDSSKNIIQIIFQSGWKGKPPAIHRILKIHNNPRTLARFEEYRDMVRSRAARLLRTCDVGEERCIADGNERLRFYCSTILCALGRTGLESPGSRPVGVCGSQFCSTCGIVRHGFTGKQADLDGIATHSTTWGAHASLAEDLEEEFAFLHVRRAMLVCRVVAGRVARGGVDGVAEKGVFDSVVPVSRRDGRQPILAGEEELLVFNPRAVLPCFVIIYSA